MSTKFGRRASIAALKSVASKRLVPGNAGQISVHTQDIHDTNAAPMCVKVTFLDGSEKEYDLVEGSTVADLLQVIQSQLQLPNTVNCALLMLITGHKDKEDVEGLLQNGVLYAASANASRKLSPTEFIYDIISTVSLELRPQMKFVFKSLSFPTFLMRRTNIDTQWQLAYVECMFMIATGRYFMTEDEAMQVGGLILQIEHGDYQPARHSNEFLKSMLLKCFPNPLRREFQSLISFQTTLTKKYIDRYIARAKLCYARLSGTERLEAQQKLLQFVNMFSPFYGSYQIPFHYSKDIGAKIKSINNIPLTSELGTMLTLAITEEKLLLVTTHGLIIQQPFHQIMKWTVSSTPQNNLLEFRYWFLLEDHHRTTNIEYGGTEGEYLPSLYLSAELRESMIQLGRCDVISLEVCNANEISSILDDAYTKGNVATTSRIFSPLQSPIGEELTRTTTTADTAVSSEAATEEVASNPTEVVGFSPQSGVDWIFSWNFNSFSPENNVIVKCCDIFLSSSTTEKWSSFESVRFENSVSCLLQLLEECDEDRDEADEMRLANLADLTEDVEGGLLLASAGVEPEDERGSQSTSKKGANHLSLKSLRRASRILFQLPTNTASNSSTNPSIAVQPTRVESKRFAPPPPPPNTSSGSTIMSSSPVASMTRQSSKYRGIPYNLVSGEDMLFEIDDQIDWTINTVKHFRGQHILSGSICVTNYRIILTANWSDQSSFKHVPSAFREISIPIAAIHKLGVSAAHKDSVYIYCRDYRVVRIAINDSENYKEKQAELLQTLNEIIFPLAGATNNNRETARMIKVRSKLFAYFFSSPLSLNDLAWDLSDMRDEYSRQGLTALECWQIYDNSDYALSDTYPSHIALPRYLDDGQIRTAAAFRSRGRLPAITYRHVATGAVLTRSSQPFVGLIQKKCSEDEQLLHLYRCKGRVIQGDEKLYILDARGKVAAALNMASGRGTEDVSVYGNAELIFGNIENIHVMRSSVESFCEHLSITSSPFIDVKELIQSTESGNPVFYSNLDECGWLKHVRMIILSGVLTAEKLHIEGSSVLVHCSDGWDRTAQICCVAEMLLDPFYRTITGFAVLIEKDWCAFGHKFQDRYGSGQESSTAPDEKSPVFIQFLDATFQLLIQFPTAFEFNEDLLLFVANHLVSGLFGNFLGNSDKERKTLYEVTSATKSIWAYVLQYKSKFINSAYRSVSSPIWPSTAVHRTKLWERYWLRWDLTAHPRDETDNVAWDDDWGTKSQV